MHCLPIVFSSGLQNVIQNQLINSIIKFIYSINFSFMTIQTEFSPKAFSYNKRNLDKTLSNAEPANQSHGRIVSRDNHQYSQQLRADESPGRQTLQDLQPKVKPKPPPIKPKVDKLCNRPTF